MISYALGVEDLADTRFALSPMHETVLSLRVLRDPGRHALLLPWRRSVADRLGALDVDLLLSLVGDRGALPDYLTPRPSAFAPPVDEELALVRATAPAIVRRPRAVRPWQHVLEPLAGYLALAERLHRSPEHYSGAWNFGPRADDMRAVDEIAAALTSALGDGASFTVQAEASAPHEAGLLLLDASKSRRELGWGSWLELEEALVWIAQWHRARQAGASVRQITLEQIGRYEARIGATATETTAPAVN